MKPHLAGGMATDRHFVRGVHFGLPGTGAGEDLELGFHLGLPLGTGGLLPRYTGTGWVVDSVSSSG